MILATVITFAPVKTCILPTSTGNYIHGLFLNILQGLDPVLAEKLHQDSRAKPFTVSPIFGDLVHAGSGTNELNSNSKYWCRFTSLSDELTQLLLADLSSAKDRTFVIGNQEMKVLDITMDSSEHQWAGMSSHQKIYDKYIVKQEGIEPIIKFHVRTPTFFHQEERSLILPLPTPFFYSTLEKWDVLSGIPLDRGDFIEWLNKSCVVSRYEIKTRMWNFEKYKYLGFVGEVEFTDLEKQETAYRAIWNMLCHYSFWCGIGAKTTMGFGMAQRL